MRSTVRKVSPSLGDAFTPMRASVSPVDRTIVDGSPSRLPSWRSHAGVLVRNTDESRAVPLWLRQPCRYEPAVEQDDIELATRLDIVFADFFDSDTVPALAEVVGACGYSSVVQMCNDARRKGPQRMRLVTRALLAMTAYYERLAQEGNRIALAILERIPQFDDLEAPEQVATRAFAPQPQEHIVHLTGMDRKEDRGRDLSPLDAYNQIIGKQSFEDISNSIELEADEDGVFQVPLDQDEYRGASTGDQGA
jgi:hypothetical protein